jgi:hypothetical protein
VSLRSSSRRGEAEARIIVLVIVSVDIAMIVAAYKKIYELRFHATGIE